MPPATGHLAADKSGSRKADGTPIWSPKTINGTMVPLREMLRHAAEWGDLDTSPAAMVRPLRRAAPAGGLCR